jgi:small subunit ribosomal protein S1
MTEENKEIFSMKDCEQEISKSFKKISEGDILTGTVVSVTDKEIILDLNSYTEGIIHAEDLSSDPSFHITDISVGDIISATVIRTDDGEGNILLSKKAANDILAWNRLSESLENRTIFHLKIAGIVNGGAIVYAEGIRGFIPASKLDLNYVENLEEWLNKEVDCIVITADAENKRLVLSAKDVALERVIEEKNQKISKIKEGTVVEGRIDSIKQYGAFVDLGDNISGLLHVSQITDKRIKSPSAVLNIGDTVKVKIISVKDGKIGLSMKALNDLTAKEIEEDIPSYHEDAAASTSLADLLSNINLNS